MYRQLVLLLLGFMVAQTANGQVPPDDLQKLKNDLKSELRAELAADIREAIAQALDPSADQQGNGLEAENTVPIPADQQSDGLESIRPIPTVEQRLAALERAQRRIDALLLDHGTAIGQIATRDENGSYRWKFSANSQQARDELKSAIKSTVPLYGRFIVRNPTPYHKWIIVNNGLPRHIWPYDDETFIVRPGGVTSRVDGSTQTYTWHIGVPDFRQVVQFTR